MYYKMPKFDIYMLWGKDCNGNILRYYGSTTNFNKRKYNHKNNYKTWVKNGRPNIKGCASVFILDNGDWKMEKIAEIDGERWEARKLEGEYQKNNECVNVVIASRTKKEYWVDNKDKLTEYQKQYLIDNKDKLAEKYKEYANNNKDKIAKYQKQYRADNKAKLTEQKKEYNEKNKQHILEKHREKITCECGAEVLNYGIPRHRKTKKHINLLSNNESNM